MTSMTTVRDTYGEVMLGLRSFESGKLRMMTAVTKEDKWEVRLTVKAIGRIS